MNLKTLVNLFMLLGWFAHLAQAAPLGTAFTYQGRLSDGAGAANGIYDLRFAIYDTVTNGSLVSGPITNAALPVANGLFTVTLDFGSVFDGNGRWLEIGVRTNGGAGAFTTLTPRQSLTPSPYALYAPNAGAAATVTAVPLSALPASVLRLDTNQQMNVMGDISLRSATPLLTEGFEATTFPPTSWATGGSQPWFRTNTAHSEGEWSAASGGIVDGESTYIQFTYNVPVATSITFDWLVDSERDYDFLSFSVDGVEKSSISGANFWTTAAFPVSSGTHTFRWAYTKDGSVSVGEDRGWIDNVRLAAGSGSLSAESLRVTGSAYTEGLRVSGSSYLDPNVGIGTLNPVRPLQIGDAGTYGSQGLIRLAARATYGSENRIWDIGVRQTESDLSAAGYCFIIDDTQLGTDPEFLVHWGNGFVGIGRTNPVSALDVNGTVTATAFVGNASGLTDLSAANVTGVLALARLPGAVLTNNQSGVSLTGAFTGNGGGLTNLDAADLTGTIADARLSGNVARLNINQTFTGSNRFAGVVTLTNAANTLAGSHFGDGSGLTNINAAHITGFSLPSGMTVVSTLANDPSLVTNGYRPMMTVPAPAWGKGSASNAPSARTGHTAIWDSQRLIVWGGSIAPGAYVGSGAMYYPDSDRWEIVSAINAPGARAGHTAVWSGSEMIVWGGYGTNSWLNTGGRFYPDQQVWKTVSTTNAPVERSGHIAVWTGTRMFVWGGQNANGLLNNGALYDPVSNQWTTLTLPSPPEARFGATAVWTGDRVLVWGGEGVLGVLSNGAQLLCASGIPTQWVAMTSANAPAARRSHTAIWASDKMLVWGGQDGGVPIGNGAGYDPVANAWTALSSNGAPVASFDHAAVWTGQEMLIVGGSTSVAELASGSAYDPATSVWRPLSSSGNPQARTEATASWTGTELLVFGGRAQGQYLSALQRLVPQPVWYFYRKL